MPLQRLTLPDNLHLQPESPLSYQQLTHYILQKESLIHALIIKPNNIGTGTHPTQSRNKQLYG